MRHAPISIGKTWATKYWPDRCFAWYLSVSEVNANYSQEYFHESINYLPQIGFRRILAKEHLENTIGVYGNGGGSGVGLRSIMDLHELITKPLFTVKCISNTHRWYKVKVQYQQSRCTKYSK